MWTADQSQSSLVVNWILKYNIILLAVITAKARAVITTKARVATIPKAREATIPKAVSEQDIVSTQFLLGAILSSLRFPDSNKHCNL